MATCYLFTEYWEEDGCLCLSLDDEGKVQTDVQKRDFQSIRALQAQAQTIVVESSRLAGFFDLELPWLPDKKARLAIPFALENILAHNMDDLHFAFDRPHYQDGHYLIVVFPKERMQHILASLHKEQIRIDRITVDFFALNPNEFCITEHHLLMNNALFKGSLSPNLAQKALGSLETATGFRFTNSTKTIKIKKASKEPIPYALWLAERLQRKSSINLCQGPFEQRSGKAASIQKGYLWVGILALIWLFSIPFFYGISWFILNQRIKGVDKKIAQIYYQFFPNATEVIAPQFRVSALLTAGSALDQETLLRFLGIFATAVGHSPTDLRTLSFQNKILTVHIRCKDFASLAQLQEALKRQHVQVTQLQAATEQKGVAATLEIR